MGKDRKVVVKDMRGTKDCPDLFAVISLYEEKIVQRDGKKIGLNSSTQITSLSRQEAKEIVEGLNKILGGEDVFDS